MIHPVLAKKYIAQSALLWWACGAALFGFAWVRVWVVSLLDMERFRTVLEQFRDFEKFAPVQFDQMITYPGRVGMTFEEPMVILCVVVWSVARGSDVISGELGRGTLEMLLAQPVSRGRLLFSHAAVSMLGLAALVLLLWLGIYVGLQLTTVQETIPQATFKIPFLQIEIPLSPEAPETVSVKMIERVSPTVFASGVLNLFAFGFFLLGFSSLVSSWDRYRWRTIGIVITVYVIQSIMFGLGLAAEPLRLLKHMTFLTCYRPEQLILAASDPDQPGPWRFLPMGDQEWLGPMMYPALLMLLGVLCYAGALAIFRRRDLPAPL